MPTIRRLLRDVTPAPIRRVAKYAIAATKDVADLARGRARDPRVPPRRSTFVGNGDFQAVGRELLALLTGPGGLTPTAAVLDVGSGQGRLALALAKYLAPTATYDGFEVVKDGVDWCQRVYADDARFRFQHADLYNAHYNPGGRQQADQFHFPYPERSFDFAVLTSVFTHLQPSAVEQYIRELARVVRPGGRVAATMFLLDDESRRLVRAGIANRLFLEEDGPAAYEFPENREASVAQDEGWAVDAFTRAGFAVTVHHGAWSGRADGVGSQDLLVAVRAR